MKAYAFNAALQCQACGEKSVAQCKAEGIEDNGDSNQFPQGPYSNGGGEADCPQSCDICFTFLENPLTDDGLKYVVEAASEFGSTNEATDESWEDIAQYAESSGNTVVAEWIRFYLAPGL